MPKKLKTKTSSPPVIVIDGGNRGELFSGIYEAANELGWRMLDLRVTRNSLAAGLNVLGLFTNRGVDNPMVQEFWGKGLPVIRVGSFPNPKEDQILPAVIIDMETAGRMAADHFAARRFEHIGFVGNYPWAQAPYLYNAFREQALERGCKCHLLQVKALDPEYRPPAKDRFEFRMKQVKEWLQSLPKPVGIFTYHDESAAGLYTAAREVGLEVPEEVAFLGLGNDAEICEFLPVPLSSIEMNYKELGRRAVELLNHIITKHEPPKEPIRVQPIEVVDRQSTNLLAVPDPVVARGLRFIWDHFAEQISVDDIAAAAGVARSTLTRRFRACLNHSVNLELRRKRLEKSSELLRSTRLSIADVASQSGFPSPPYFQSAFKDAFGKTPGAFRKHQ